MSHPPAFKLDALAAGDADAGSAAHVAACEACAAYVTKLAADAERFRAGSDPATFERGVLARAGRRGSSLRFAKVGWLAAPALAAAAAIVLSVRGSGPTSVVAPIGVASSGAGTHFKGGLSVVAIRERGGTQERLSGPFEVARFDRVRIEIAIDRDEPITAGLLSNDGSWALLLAPAELAAGTHLSELAARFDDAPTDALLLVGAPDDVARARATRRFEGVVAWRVRSNANE
jgi:hypothetical protein